MYACEFECKKKGSCINEDLTCLSVIGCRFIRSKENKCSMCIHERYCSYLKDVLPYLRNSSERRYSTCKQ